MHLEIKKIIAFITNFFQLRKPWDFVLIFLINLLISIPLFIILHQNIIVFNWYLNFDRILLGLITLTLIQLALIALRNMALFSLFLTILVLLMGTFFGKYGFYEVIDDYNSMIYTMQDNPNPQDIIIEKLLPFPNKSKIIAAIEFDNPKIRNFALMTTTKHFKNNKKHKEYRMLIQCFAIFKEINTHWNYVNDPKGREYIAKATESLAHFSGDCDDHSILMAACIKAIGGTPRLIHTGNHIYPELLIGTKSDLNNINLIIKKELFKKESKNQKLFYHIDERGTIWLNLDYTARYPGGPFLKKEILGALTLD